MACEAQQPKLLSEMDESEKNRAWQRLRTAVNHAPEHIAQTYKTLVDKNSQAKNKRAKLNDLLAVYLEASRLLC